MHCTALHGWRHRTGISENLVRSTGGLHLPGTMMICRQGQSFVIEQSLMISSGMLPHLTFNENSDDHLALAVPHPPTALLALGICNNASYDIATSLKAIS
jgi:hypothetical protein